ncbi:hypothetical protein DTO271G3_6281 [Paecilomyces variotii]|nr:hypothetical protein DTO271G3_6281 [Paecilomyces variotii]
MSAAELGEGDSNAAIPRGRRPSPFLVDPITGKILRGLAAGIGLTAEAYHHHKEKKKVATANEGENNPPPVIHEGNNSQHHPPDEDNHSTRHAEQDTLDEYYSSSIPQQMYEATWQLDEAQDGLNNSHEPPPYSVSEEQLPQLAESFLQNHSPPPFQRTQSPTLALPVLITQRRPGKRSRGFIRAYAPLLNDVGIDQATFLDFIDNLNKAVQPSGLIQALNLASIAGLLLQITSLHSS